MANAVFDPATKTNTSTIIDLRARVLVPLQGRLFGDIANLKALLRIFSPYTYQGAYALGQRLGQPGMPMYLTVSC